MTAAPIRVLVVDDHDMFVESLVRMIGKQPDIEVVGTARNVKDGVEAAKLHRPQVVLMDFKLPDGDGIDAARSIREAEGDIRIVMLTGNPDDTILLEAIDAGCSGYITKDKAVGEAISAIRAAHSGEASISSQMLARLLPRLRPSFRPVGAALSSRELEVLELLAEGVANADIAAKLVLSVNTVRNHVQNILTKLSAHSKLEAVARALREGVIAYPERTHSGRE